MASGRFVSKTISHSEQLASVSLKADYLFGRCIPHLDVEGRMAGSPRLVKAIAVPLREDILESEISELLKELAGAMGSNGEPLVYWYEVGGQQVLQFPGFGRHNKIRADRESKSRFPPAPVQRKRGRKLANMREGSGSTPGAVPLKLSLRSSSRPSGGDEESPEFVEAWDQYPKRPNNNRAEAWEAWRARVREGEDEQVMLRGTRAYASWVAATGTDPKYIKQAATFYGPKRHYLNDFDATPWQVRVYDPVTGDITPEAARLLGVR